MTVPRLKAMTAYWKHSPPVHLMIAEYFGVGKKKQQKNSDFDEFMRDCTMVKGG